ncbi:cytochrome P450 6A1-like, partial [Anoplophora glabripennis]|uniref:cytochrome P450 6A1-like n=1 Tax=Anoplophora glabripennis TaxID=217634 RepID=UPI0008756ADF
MLTKKFYQQFKSRGHMIGGVYIGIEPYIIVLDPECIKDILIRDFQNFTDRGVYMNEKDPLSVHILSQPGPQWKDARVKLSTIFTSSKIKAMFETMLDCSGGLKGALEKLSQQKDDVDILEVVSCYNTDVI